MKISSNNRHALNLLGYTNKDIDWMFKLAHENYPGKMQEILTYTKAILEADKTLTPTLLATELKLNQISYFLHKYNIPRQEEANSSLGNNIVQIYTPLNTQNHTQHQTNDYDSMDIDEWLKPTGEQPAAPANNDISMYAPKEDDITDQFLILTTYEGNSVRQPVMFQGYQPFRQAQHQPGAGVLSPSSNAK